MNLPLKKTSTIAALGLALWLLGAGFGWCDFQKVTAENQALYQKPDFIGPPIAQVPKGAEVMVMVAQGDWYLVRYQGKEGWMHHQAFPLRPKARELPPDGVPVVGDILKVTGGLVSMHAEPDFISAKTSEVIPGTEAKVLKVAGDWLKVKCLGGTDETGWLHRKDFQQVKSPNQQALLSGEPVRQPQHIEVALGVKAEKAPPEGSPRKELDHRRIKGEQFLLRDPDFNSPHVVKVPKDTKVKVLKRQGDWFAVEYQGKTGWLHRKAFWVSW